MQADEHDDLDLLAFRYAAGDMSPEEALAFEQQLADDQQAREAVSRAVELGQRLADAAPTPAGSTASPVPAPQRVHPAWRQLLAKAAWPAVWMAAGAAAALVMVNVLAETTPPGEGRKQATQREGTQQAAAADPAVWARLQAGGDWATQELERWIDEPQALAADDAEDSLGSASIPTWVFAARPSAQQRGTP